MENKKGHNFLATHLSNHTSGGDLCRAEVSYRTWRLGTGEKGVVQTLQAPNEGLNIDQEMESNRTDMLMKTLMSGHFVKIHNSESQPIYRWNSNQGQKIVAGMFKAK